jgi:hypothetical protein
MPTRKWDLPSFAATAPARPVAARTGDASHALDALEQAAHGDLMGLVLTLPALPAPFPASLPVRPALAVTPALPLIRPPLPLTAAPARPASLELGIEIELEPLTPAALRPASLASLPATLAPVPADCVTDVRASAPRSWPVHAATPTSVSNKTFSNLDCMHAP